MDMLARCQQRKRMRASWLQASLHLWDIAVLPLFFAMFEQTKGCVHLCILVAGIFASWLHASSVVDIFATISIASRLCVSFVVDDFCKISIVKIVILMFR